MSSPSYAWSVSAMPPEIHPAEAGNHPLLQTLLRYWRNLRADRVLPGKPSNLKEIGPFLKHVHFTDVLENGAQFRFRILGDAVFQGLPENQTGRLVSEHPDMGVRLRFPMLMQEVARTRAPICGRARRTTIAGDFFAESIWLPFGERDVSQIMGMGILTTMEAA